MVGRVTVHPDRSDRAPRRAQPPERDGNRCRLPGPRHEPARPSRPVSPPSPASSHRLELIATQDGVSYVNDSKATNVASTIVALRSYAGGVHLIAGGTGKNQDFSPLARLVSERCVAVHLIGEATPDLAQALAPTRVPLYDDGDLATALANARERAHTGEVVLLSPACASFDQYENFEARGEHFRQLVESG